MPEALTLMKPACKPGLVDLDVLVRRMIFHPCQRKVIAAAMARFADDLDIKLSGVAAPAAR